MSCISRKSRWKVRTTPATRSPALRDNMQPGGCMKIEKKVLLRAPRERVWRALADSTEFGVWFGVRFAGPFMRGVSLRGVIVPTTVDAEVAAAQKPYEGKPFDITVEQLEPERRS